MVGDGAAVTMNVGAVAFALSGSYAAAFAGRALVGVDALAGVVAFARVAWLHVRTDKEVR